MKEKERKGNLGGIRLALLPVVLALFMFAISMVGGMAASAEETGTSAKPQVKLNYLTEMAKITVDTAGKKLYVSTDKKKTWDRLEFEGTSAFFDFSSVLSTKEVTVSFGYSITDENQIIDVVLEALPKIKTKTSGASIVVTEIPVDREVEFRKGTSREWTLITGDSICLGKVKDSSDDDNNYFKLPKPVYGTNQVEVDLSICSLRGGSFVFRVAPTMDHRAGKDVKAKVSKMANAPSVKVDGTKLSLSGFKANGSEYRLSDEAGWKVTANKIEPIGDIFGVDAGKRSIPERTASSGTSIISVAGLSCAIQGGDVEVRTAASKTKPASRSKVVSVTNQAVFSDLSKVTIKTLEPKSKTDMTSRVAIYISDASSTNPYEYALVSTMIDKLDVSKIKWTSVTSVKDVEIKAGKYDTTSVNLNNGTALLVRKKSTVDKTTKQVYLASTCAEYLFTSATEGSWQTVPTTP